MAISRASNSEQWDEIHGFASLGEYQRFLAWVSESLYEQSLSEVPVLNRFSGSEMFNERWFVAPSGQIWRLVGPEAPFRGAFLRVADSGET